MTSALAAAVLASAASPLAAQTAATDDHGSARTPTPAAAAAAKPMVAVKDFATASLPFGASQAASEQACPVQGPPQSDAQGGELVNGAGSIAAKVTADLKKKLSKRMEVLTDGAPNALPFGALVIVGCITNEDPGSPIKRMVGFGMGASRLAAHVRLLTMTEMGLVPTRDFDVDVSAKNLLPPLGPAGLVVHGVKQVRQTLSADADKLAGKIAAQLKDASPTQPPAPSASGA